MNELAPQLKFIFSKDSYENAEIIIYGFPLDATTVYRPGTRFAPNRIREMSYALETYSPIFKRDLADVDFYDVGNNYSPFEPMYDLGKALSTAEEEIRKMVNDGKKLLVLGGEHLITYTVVKAMATEELTVLHFDAHADLRDTYDGCRLSHATVMRRVAEIIGKENLYQFGIRSGVKEEFEYGEKIHNDIESVRDAIGELSDKKIYLSIDIDVFDPAFAPGTGTPEPGGCTPREFFKVLKLLGELNVVGADIVEISPPFDTADVTSLLGAKIARELIAGVL